MTKLFEKTDHEIDQFKEDIEFQSRYVWSEEDHILNDDSDGIENEWKSSRLKVVYKTFENEYNSHVDKGIYFYGCPYEIYQSTFNERMKKFLSRHDDHRLIDFIESEFESGAFLFKRPYVSSERMKKIQSSLRRRYEFLLDKVNEEGYELILLENDTVKIDKKNNNLIFEDDISESWNNKERIIALYHLGVLDYLKNQEELTTVNKIAKAIKSFTGINQSTIQSYINPIFNSYAAQEKSALNDQNQVKHVADFIDKHIRN